MIKLIAIDLDGTLFSENLVIGGPEREAITAAQELGVQVALATGRMVRSVRPIAADLGIEAQVICYQGAVVHDLREERTLLHNRLPKDLALETIDFVHARRFFCNAYIDDSLYVAEINEGTRYYSRLNNGIPMHPVGDLQAFVAAAEHGPTKLSVVLPEEAQTDHLLAELRERFGSTMFIVKSYPLFAETVNAEANKGVALATLARHLGLRREETMAIGDGANDIQMLQWAGVGVAMGQSRPEVKAAADYVTGSLAEHGVAEAIRRFVLEPAWQETKAADPV